MEEYMENLMEIQKIIFDNKVKKDFNTTNVELEFCLTYSELAEAYEAYKKKLPTLGEELADVAIYLYGIAEILGYDKTIELIKESDSIYLKFGADTKVYGIDKAKEITEIRRKAINANLKLIECPIRHLGTEEGYKIYSKLQEHLLSAGIEIIFNTMVDDIIIENYLVYCQ